ncbi:MAG: class I SAM-dependent methyltransferase [Acidobacteriota bacterium]|nr:class I SAM-dependent methyltransferase [Acidobacteriota bacterium]
MTQDIKTESAAVCHFCGEPSGTYMYSARSLHGKEFHLYRCSACRAAYLFPQPSDEELAEAYADDYYGEGEEKFSGWIETVLNAFRRRRARTVLKRTPAEAKVLDIGCGNGMFLKYVAEEGRRGYGIELPGKSLERARRIPSLTLKEGKLEPDDFEPDSFDMVTLWHVFEHLDKPRQTLDIISGITKPGGYLALSLPNIDSWQAERWKADWFHLDPPRHLFFLGPEPLIQQVTDRGFRLVAKNFFSLEQNPFGMQQSLLNRRSAHRDVLFEALKGRPGGGRGYSSLNITLQKLFYMGTFPLFAALSLCEAAAGRGGTMELIFQKLEKDG